jgi:hypothetical protein
MVRERDAEVVIACGDVDFVPGDHFISWARNVHNVDFVPEKFCTI